MKSTLQSHLKATLYNFEQMSRYLGMSPYHIRGLFTVERIGNTPGYKHIKLYSTLPLLFLFLLGVLRVHFLVQVIRVAVLPGDRGGITNVSLADTITRGHLL